MGSSGSKDRPARQRSTDSLVIHKEETNSDDPSSWFCCARSRKNNTGGYHVAGHEAGVLSHSSSRRLSLPEDAMTAVQRYRDTTIAVALEDVPFPSIDHDSSDGSDGEEMVHSVDLRLAEQSRASVNLSHNQSTAQRIFGASNSSKETADLPVKESPGFPDGLNAFILRWDVPVELSWSGPRASIQSANTPENGRYERMLFFFLLLPYILAWMGVALAAFIHRTMRSVPL